FPAGRVRAAQCCRRSGRTDLPPAVLSGGGNLEKKEHSAGDWNVMRFYPMPARAAKRGRIGAWLVHSYTASGAVLALAGVQAVFGGNARLAFAAMYLATIVDATDGVLARRARVKTLLPAIDGGRIDDLVDYLTFVFLPMIVVLRFQMLPQPIAFAV